MTKVIVLSSLPWLLLGLGNANAASPPAVQVTVNSNTDGPVQADDALTLREAIEIVNGTLPLEQLSSAEKAQVSKSTAQSRIEFNLPPNQTIIRLLSELPQLDSPSLVVDGTTQPGYDAAKSATAEIAIPIPVVEITPALDKQVFRGLTIVADGVTVRGLSLYGFTSSPQVPVSTPPADIFIAHRNPPPNTSGQQPPADNFPFSAKDVPPKDVVIENNWLGIMPNEQMPPQTSAFGVSVFNSLGTTIRRNRIYNHDGSGIITSVRAENLKVVENIIVGNGIAGMPDGLRLEGVISNSEINSNLICANDGSGVYLFKPQGSVQIRDNNIIFNGRRLRRAAVYLMGSGHQVTGNQISYQTGPGVVVTSYPKSTRNVVSNNKFASLEGLSIDLNTQQNVDPIHFQIGDGPNPQRDSPNRRKETANEAINAPQFISSEFFVINGKTTISGKADPGSAVEIYRVRQTGTQKERPPNYNPLSEPLGTVTADKSGQFTVSLSSLQPGDRVSAIATDLKYGTSEPALNSLVRSPDSTVNPTISVPAPVIPQCTTRPSPPPKETPPETPSPQPSPPEPIRIQVPQNVHFALDKDIVSPESAAVLDRVAAVLQQYPFILVELQGHTDPRASDAYNLDLANRRALAVRNYLRRRGIAPERLTIRSFGESRLLTTGTTRLDYALNRRVELIYKDARGIDLIIEPQEEDLQLEPASRSR